VVVDEVRAGRGLDWRGRAAFGTPPPLNSYAISTATTQRSVGTAEPRIAAGHTLAAT
jgi:hypothetical protein